MIIQGANDPRVTQAEAEQMVAAMKKNGIAYEYLLFPDEGHGVRKARNKLQMGIAVERFFKKHLGR